MSCLLSPKSSTRAALPSGVRAGLSSVSSTTTLLSLVASAAASSSVPWAKAVTERLIISTRAAQRAARVAKIFLFFMVGVLLFVVVGGRSGHARDRTTGEHGVQLLRGQPQGAHHLNDFQVLRLGFLRLQRFQLVLVLRDLLADLGNLLANALDFVLSHFNHSFSHKSALPVHQAVALDALVGQGITLDLAGVSRIALHGVDPAAHCADHTRNTVGAVIMC